MGLSRHSEVLKDLCRLMTCSLSVQQFGIALEVCAPTVQVGPSIGATYALYALMVQDWGIGGLRSFSHLNKQDEAALAAEMGAAD